MKAKVKSAVPEFREDYMQIEPIPDSPRISFQISLQTDKRQREYSEITVDIGDLYRALKRAGIELDTTNSYR